jgi:hypothetical protein
VALVFLAAVAGVVVGRQFVEPATQPGAELHAFLHDQLSLDADQERRLHALEEEFAASRAALEAEMRADNARLAEAIAAEHGNGPQVASAVDASHMTMGTLQKETLAHIFAMRALLRPDQAAKFDAAVTKALTEDAR